MTLHSLSKHPPPHDVTPNSVARVMRLVIFALTPAVVMSTIFLGPGIIVQILLGTLTVILWQWWRNRGKRD